MRLETLDDALLRARAAHEPLRSREWELKDEHDRCAKLHQEFFDAGRADGREAFLENAGRLFDAQAAAAALAPIIAASKDLQHALQYARHAWKVAMPGHGQSAARFFVRSFRIEDGKPVAYDPFWIETCVEIGVDDLSKLALHAVWASGGDLRPGGSGPSDPILPVRRPFGPASEAARRRCSVCGDDGYVIGFKELCHWTEDDDWPYLQSLSTLCLTCPRLELIAERSDLPPAKLHP
ncbi:MAG: hypothetical protein AAB554_05290 [Patescibacteria group bacterium]